VAHYIDPNSQLTQCELASKVVGKGKNGNIDCCANPDSDACDQPAPLQDALDAIQRLDGKPFVGVLPFEDIQKKINSGFPICVRIAWGEGGGAHFVAIDGCGTSPAGDQLVHVQDPFFGASTLTLENLVNSYQGSGQWTAAFLLKE